MVRADPQNVRNAKAKISIGRNKTEVMPEQAEAVVLVMVEENAGGCHYENMYSNRNE